MDRSDFLEKSYMPQLVENNYEETGYINLPDGIYQKRGGGYKIDIYDGEEHTGYIILTNNGIRGMWTDEYIEVRNGKVNEDVYKIMSDIKWKRKEKIGEILK